MNELSKRDYKARKEHVCELCGASILRGEQMTKCIVEPIEDAKRIEIKYHKECYYAANKLNLVKIHTTTNYYFNKMLLKWIQEAARKSKQRCDMKAIKALSTKELAQLVSNIIIKSDELRRNRIATELEKNNVSRMIDVLICISLLDRYFIDYLFIKEESDDFKYDLKKDFNKVELLLAREHERAYNVFLKDNKELASGFVFTCDKIDGKLNEAIALKGEERCIALLSCLLDIAEENMQNNSLTCDFDDVLIIRKILSKHIELKSNDAIKFIINNELKNRLMQVVD